MTSVIIAYKDEHIFLREAVQSVMDQALGNIELILVCNQSTLPQDNKPLSGLDFPYKFIHEPRSGSAFARNTGLRNARGEYVQFLDVDDLLLPDKIKHQLEIVSKGAVVSPHLFKTGKGKIKKSKWLPEDIWCGLLNSGLGSTSSMLWHRDSLVKSGGWSVHYQSHQEYELLFRMVSLGSKITCLEKRETIVRERASGSITLNSQPVRAIEGIEIREKMWQHIIEHRLDTPARKNAFLQYIFRQLRNLYRLDQKKAMLTYKKYFKGASFVPEHTGIPFYAFMFHGFGFGMTEWIFTSYSRIRNKFLPFLPRNH